MQFQLGGERRKRARRAAAGGVARRGFASGRILRAAGLLLALLASPAAALQDGIFGMAQEGCGCHGGLGIPPNTTTRPFIVGLPPEGYVGGQKYELTLGVIGVTVPAGTEARAGFNLQVTSGRIGNVDPVKTLVREWSECDVMMSVKACTPETCGVKTTGETPDPSCANGTQCFVRYCATPGEGNCRACRTALVDIQATHTSVGNDDVLWDLDWTAPSAGSGPATFYMAGNFVNGDGKNDHDPFDVWSVALPITVQEKTLDVTTPRPPRP